MIFDALVVVSILVGIGLGVWRGFAWQLAAIGSLVSGFVVGLPLSKLLAPLFGSSAPFNRFAALAAVYVVISLGVYVLALTYRVGIVEKCKLKEWDKHVGGALGAVKGFLLCLVVTFFAITLSEDLREPVLSTRLGKVMGRTMDALHPIWPPGVHEILHPYLHHLDEPPPPPPPPAAPQAEPSAPEKK